MWWQSMGVCGSSSVRSLRLHQNRAAWRWFFRNLKNFPAAASTPLKTSRGGGRDVPVYTVPSRVGSPSSSPGEEDLVVALPPAWEDDASSMPPAMRTEHQRSQWSRCSGGGRGTPGVGPLFVRLRAWCHGPVGSSIHPFDDPLIHSLIISFIICIFISFIH